MFYKKHYLYTFLTASFLIALNSCKKSDTIGLSDLDNNDKLHDTTITVTISTEKEDSVLTNNIAQNPFGLINDADFGTTEAGLALGFNIPSENFNFGTDPEIDSAVLVLKYGNEFYGDSLSLKTASNPTTLSLKVHQLNETIASEAYYSTKTWNRVDSNGAGIALNKVVRSFSWRDSVAVKRIVDGRADTFATVAPHLRVKLDNAIFAKLQSALASGKTSNSFRNYFKGLYLSVKKSESTGKGGITFFDLQSTGNISGIEVYYKNKTTNNALDTNMVLFSATSALAASAIKHSPIAAVKSALGNTNSDFVYVQPLGGYRAKIKFPALENLKNLVAKSDGERKSISINRAELTLVSVKGSEDTAIFKPAQRLEMYRTDIAGSRRPIPDNAIGTDVRYIPEVYFGGFKEGPEYKFTITAYVQDLLSGKLKEYDTFISPIRKTLTNTANTQPSATTAARAILGGKQTAKVKIIYTRPD